MNKYIRHIFNCTRLFLCGDQTYDRDSGYFDNHLDEGMTIDEVIEMNNRSKRPLTVYTWDNLDLIMKEDRGEWAIFDFDLTNLPDYLK